MIIHTSNLMQLQFAMLKTEWCQKKIKKKSKSEDFFMTSQSLLSFATLG